MFQPKPSRKRLEARISELHRELDKMTDRAFQEMTRAEDFERELIAAKADRRRLEGRVAELEAQIAKPETSVEDTVEQEDLSGVLMKTTCTTTVRHVGDTVEEHPDFIAAKARIEREKKRKKGGIRAARRALIETRARLYKEGFK
jgi:hypothetical protein